MAWMLDVLYGAALEVMAGVFLKRVWRAVMAEKCMINGCMRTRAAGKRGLCLVCYSKAKEKVDRGETTWDTLVAYKLCQEEASVFDEAYNQAMKDKENY